MGFFKEIGKHIFGTSCSACENKWASLEELKGTPTQADWMRRMLEDLEEVVVSYAQVASSFFVKVVGFSRIRNVRIAAKHLFGTYG